MTKQQTMNEQTMHKQTMDKQTMSEQKIHPEETTNKQMSKIKKCNLDNNKSDSNCLQKQQQ